MFKRVGKEIRIWAKVLVILEMIPIVLAAIVCALYCITEGPSDIGVVLGIALGILIIVVGYFLARLSAIMLYSWGELVERVVCIDERLEKIEHRPAAPAVPAAPVAPAPAPYNPPTYPSYAPPVAPAPQPVVPVKPVTAVPVTNTTVNTPAMNAPISSISVNNDLEDDNEYTQAAISRPVMPVVEKAEWTCPNCGQKNSADGAWCRNCGTKKSI